MSDTPKSKVISQAKPVNFFYVWYSELCRRLNSSPLAVVKPARTKNETVLDFVGDRLKVEDWNPVIKALRLDTSLHVINIRSKLGNCQFLHDIDTEEKARRMKRRYGTLWTAYVLKSLLKSLSFSIRNNQVLTCLELDGLPMFSQYLEPLLQALKGNRTIKSFSLTHCPITDIGCQMICGHLRFTPNVEVVNLTCCHLTAESGDHLAKLIKYQQINRYCESWHNSLRYEDPNVTLMRGLKRITLNGNTDFGDQGLLYILDELDDDLWLKALDLQKCGITENISERVLDVIEYNRSLEILDLRYNTHLCTTTVEKVFNLLQQKQHFGYEPEFSWCSTLLTLPYNNSVPPSTYSVYSVIANGLQKTKSCPMKTNASPNIDTNRPLRRTKTEIVKITKTNNKQSNTNKSNKDKNQVIELSSRLNEEISRRKEIEKVNEDLQKKLDEITSVTKLVNKRNTNKIISCTPNTNNIVLPRVTECSDTTSTSQSEENSYREPINGFHKNVNKHLNGVKNGFKNGLKNGFQPNRNPEKQNGAFGIQNRASQIFHNILQMNKSVERVPEDDEDDLLKFYLKRENEKREQNTSDSYHNVEETDGSTDSQVSLYNFLGTLRSNTATANLPGKFKIRQTSCVVITEKDGGT